MRKLALVIAIATLSSCAAQEPRTLVFHVAGMQRGDGGKT